MTAAAGRHGDERRTAVEVLAVTACEAIVIVTDGMVGDDIDALCRGAGVGVPPPVVVVVHQDAAGDHQILVRVAEERLDAPTGGHGAIPARVSKVRQPRRRFLTGDGRVALDVSGRELTVAGAPVALPRLEFDLLAYVMARPGQVIAREELLGAVWGFEGGSTATITVHVRQLRLKIEADPRRPAHLKTVRGVGYRFDR